MNIFRKNILTFIALTLGNILLAQNPIYLEISDCTKEFQYNYTELSGANTNYFTYQFTINDYETVILEASTYDSKFITNNSFIASNRITCGEALANSLSVETIEMIQKEKQSVYLLKPTNNGFDVLNVTEATYQVYLPNDQYLRVITREYGFDYNGKQNHTVGAELKTAGEGELVLFHEESVDCYKKPTFMHVPIKFMETANIEYVLGLGVIRQYSDLVEHKLVTIDGQPIEQYLLTFCNPDITQTNRENIPETYSIPTDKAKISQVEDNEPLIVFDEERTTIVTTDDIDMSLVEEDVKELIENNPVRSKGKTVIYKSTPVNKQTIGNREIPSTYGTTKEATKIYKSTPTNKKSINKQNIHIVKSGETLYGISKKYDLTTLQLKALNQLEDNTIEIGQELIIKN